MKRLIAVVVASVLFVSSSICAFAAQPVTVEGDGSKSITAEDVEKLQNEIDKLEKQIKKLTKAINAKQGGSGAAKSGGSDAGNAALQRNNAVSFGTNIVAQGGHVELNGAKSNATFVITAVPGGTLSSAGTLAGSLGGTLLNCVMTSSPGVNFTSAKANFFVSGVQANDNVVAYQLQNKKWVPLTVSEVRKDHVVVNMSRHGAIAFIKVPAAVLITG